LLPESVVEIKAGHGLHGPMGLEKPEESLFMRLKEPFGKRSWLFALDDGWLIFVDAPAKNERMNVPLKKWWDWKTILSLFKI